MGDYLAWTMYEARDRLKGKGKGKSKRGKGKGKPPGKGKGYKGFGSKSTPGTFGLRPTAPYVSQRLDGQKPLPHLQADRPLEPALPTSEPAARTAQEHRQLRPAKREPGEADNCHVLC